MLIGPELHALLAKSFREEGSLVEWLSSAPGHGTGALAAALCQPTRDDYWCVIDGAAGVLSSRAAGEWLADAGGDSAVVGERQ